MYLLAPACEAIAATSKKLEKTRIVAEYLRSRTPEEAAVSAVFLSGRAFPAYQETTLQLGGTQLWRIVQAYGAATREVQRANMLLGDVGETCRLAIEGRLSDARMRLFHPIGAMLATPVETAEEAFEFFQHTAVEDKYDGIRAQAHCR